MSSEIIFSVFARARVQRLGFVYIGIDDIGMGAW